jgi:hypothetical protein
MAAMLKPRYRAQRRNKMKPEDPDNAEAPRVQTPAGQCLAAGAPCGRTADMREKTESGQESNDVSN